MPSTGPTWPGPVAGLDFTGHGLSTVPRGGGYTAELLLGDADAALNSLTDGDPTRSITVAGRGLGAYVALQIAGARAAQVHGAILVDGPGLAGGPTGPTSAPMPTRSPVSNRAMKLNTNAPDDPAVMTTRAGSTSTS